MRNEKQGNEIKLGKARVHKLQSSSLYVWFLARNCGSRYIVNLTDSTNSEPYDQLRQ